MSEMPLRPLDIINRQELSSLSRICDRIAACHLALRAAGEALLFWSSLQLAVERSPWFLPVFLLCGSWHSFWGYAGIGHEFYHGRVFSSSFFNRAAFRISSYLTLNNPKFFADSHALHHRETFSQSDQEARALQAWGAYDVFCYATVDLPLLVKRWTYILFNASGRLPGGSRLSGVTGAHRREAVAMLVFLAAAHFALWILTGKLESNLLFLLLPVTGLLPARVLAQTQHLGLAGSRDQGPLGHSRTVRLPWLLEFLYSGMNFHAEHHLAPVIPYYRLPELHAILIKRGLLSPVELWPFLRDHFGNLIRAQQPR